MNQETITVTTKGTFTLPAHIRIDMGVKKTGDRLAIHFDKTKKQVIISAPNDFQAIEDRLAPYLKNVKPLKDVSTYYSKRKPRV